MAAAKGHPTRSVEKVRAFAGVGLEGDRYALGLGYYSPDRRVSRDLTLVEGELLDDLASIGVPVASGEVRRNVTTRGIRLNELVGKRFHIGDVECRGTGRCEPCAYLEDLTGKRLLRPLVHRGGLRADILTPGEIAVGDPIRPLADEDRLGVGIFVLRESEVLLGLRRGGSGAGSWSTPGGRLESTEPVEACARRELQEETGLQAGPTRIVGEAVDMLGDGDRWRSLFVAASWIGGEPTLCEPERCEAWAWFAWERLPNPLFAPVGSFVAAGLSPWGA